MSDFNDHIMYASFWQQGIFDFDHVYSHIYSYPLFHWITAALEFVVGDMSVSGVIVSVVSLILTTVFMRNIALKHIRLDTPIQKYALDFFCITVVFISGIAGPLTGGTYYMPYGTPNVWHNPTYLPMRPFAVLSIYYFYKLYNSLFEDKNGNNAALKNAVLFAVMLFLSVLAKPNFALFFLVGAGLVVAVKMFKKFSIASIKSGAVIFACVLPTMVLMLVQKQFCDTHADTISFALQLRPISSVFSLHTLKGIASLCIPVITYFAYNGRRLIGKDIVYTIVMIMFAVSLVFWYGTVQGIDTLTNYIWSYYLSLFLASAISAIYSVRDIKNKIYWAIFGTSWGLMLLCGAIYMMRIAMVGQYNI
ncbi:MAG: hypothetical protein E7483_01710 [Ruminococcaceae bacterium]|nr:hypothetical protein [Oscillospiraceae bacterium]